MKQITIAAAIMAMAVIGSSPVFAKDQPEPKAQKNAPEIPVRAKATIREAATEVITDPETIIAELPQDNDLVLDQEDRPAVLSILRVNGI